MQQSNAYIIRFTLIMTIVVGGVLALANQALRPAQLKSIEYDTKSQILSAVMEINKESDVLNMYSQRIRSVVVDIQGNEVTTNEKGETVVAEKVDVARNYKKDYKERLYPVFMYMNESNPDQIDAFILPVYGSGLWDKIWGFVAVDKDFESIAGVSFGHKAETPGLGARIGDKSIQQRYIGKKMFDANGNFVSIVMLKGESGGGQASIDAFTDRPNEVDGLSGATLTARGVNDMMKKYLDYYQKYFSKMKNGS